MSVAPWVNDRLRGMELFAELTPEQLGWLAGAGTLRELGDGEPLFREGEQADGFFVLFRGEIVITKLLDGRQEVLARHGGQRLEHSFTGELPLLTGGEYLATALAVGSAQVMCYDRAAFFDMLERCPQVSRVLLPVLAERINAMERQAGRSRMLQGLGRVAAGLAHELNNPAAAALRAAGDLRAGVPGLAAAARDWGRLATDAELQVLDGIQDRLCTRRRLDPLAAAEAVDEVADWLADHDLDEGPPDDLDEVLAERGAGKALLDELAAGVRPEALTAALTHLAYALRTGALAEESAEAGQRVVELVRRIATYTNLDRAPEQDVDLREGLEATLALMAPRLRDVRVHRDFGGLPYLKVFPGELHQVWTNLIDNAVDAMGGRGELTISTRLEGDHAVVEFLDSGPGIPDDVLPLVFQPFFSTKDVGKGTGLGLHVSRDIVAQRHGGTIEVTSGPEGARFTVRLPVDRHDVGHD
ncbi:sensor histidine kinase [Nonomuraea sediminis]|uniref:sensor histidine kinase n=1 Tax=Nonomuraea sediminis TaxID=2835864 RepID=UPI001BDC0167|nr:ATP-binding protein [Nonomuraea sediminis]